mmetsp:Transcript_100462/g.224305  ORF Transcript_100462/g.224305 Transcript_100462/m.224305 type:complete len:208 (+) Transcript_100462:241-864(+)
MGASGPRHGNMDVGPAAGPTVGTLAPLPTGAPTNSMNGASAGDPGAATDTGDPGVADASPAVLKTASAAARAEAVLERVVALSVPKNITSGLRFFERASTAFARALGFANGFIAGLAFVFARPRTFFSTCGFGDAGADCGVVGADDGLDLALAFALACGVPGAEVFDGVRGAALVPVALPRPPVASPMPPSGVMGDMGNMMPCKSSM